MLFNSAFVAVAVVVLFNIYNRLKRFYLIRKNLREQWKGPPCHWFWGHLGMVTKGNQYPDRYISYHTEKEKEFPIGYALYAGPVGALLRLHHPLFVKEVLNASVWEAPKSHLGYGTLIPWIGYGLGTLNGSDWLQHRRLLTSSFHFDILKPYVKIMNDCASTMLEKWSTLSEDKGQLTIDVFEHSGLLALDTVLKCLMSVTSDCQINANHSIASSICRLGELCTKRVKSKNLFTVFDVLYNLSADGREFQRECSKLHKFSYSLIEDRRKKILNGCKGNNYLDFLDVLLQAKDSDGVGFTDEEIRTEIDTFVFAGHDTVSSALAWTLYCLASHLEHQEKCFEEVSSVMKGRDEVLWSDLSSLPYLTRCIKESMRIYPPAPRIARKLAKDIHVQGKTILKGTEVALSIDGVHRSELFWKDPQKFNPNRFTVEKAARQNNFAFIPFSAGPRNCIGQNFAMNELKITIAKTLKRYRFDVNSNQNIVRCVDLTYRAKDGIQLNLTARDQSSSK